MVTRQTNMVKSGLYMERVKFELTEQETKDAIEFMKEHNKVCPHNFKNDNVPVSGEHYYYKIIPGGFGLNVEIGCIYCKDAHKNITDMDNW